MKKILLFTSMMLLASCATLFTGSKSKVQLDGNTNRTPVDITIDGQRYEQVILPTKVKVKKGFKESNLKATALGYEPYETTIGKKFNAISILNLGNPVAWGIDAATGAMMTTDSKYYYLEMVRLGEENNSSSHNVKNYVEDPTIPQGAAEDRVTRDNPGESELERTIIRWYFDSAPRGSRVFWRVISSVPAEVKNTNESYLGPTPFEETRSFNILGLTYANSRDVQIEIKVTKNGYMDQVKRFNVRQAIDQQEISSFFELVPEE